MFKTLQKFGNLLNTIDIDSWKNVNICLKNISSIFLISILFLTWLCNCSYFCFLYLKCHCYGLREIAIYSIWTKVVLKKCTCNCTHLFLTIDHDQLNLICLIIYGYLRHLKLFLATRSSMIPMIIIGLAWWQRESICQC